MTILMYFGTFMFFEKSFNIYSEPERDTDGNPTSRLVLNTIMFYSFILMNLFNMLNCRVHDSEDLNIFKDILSNPLFLLIIIFEFVVTNLMVRGGAASLPSSIFGTAEITNGQAIVCWVFGALSLVVNFVAKQLPLDPFIKFAKKFDVESDKNDEIMNKFMEKAGEKYTRKVYSFIENE